MAIVKTNVEKVTEFMEFGSSIRQAFVMEAINRYAKEVVNNAPQIREGMKHSFISPDAWIAAAAEWQMK